MHQPHGKEGCLPAHVEEHGPDQLPRASPWTLVAKVGRPMLSSFHKSDRRFFLSRKDYLGLIPGRWLQKTPPNANPSVFYSTSQSPLPQNLALGGVFGTKHGGVAKLGVF